LHDFDRRKGMSTDFLAAVYLRMSMDRQEDSPERQRGAIAPYLAKNGLRLYKEYVDEARRGWEEDRAGFLRMIQDARKGLFSIIVVDELSRLSRFDPLDFLVQVAYPLRGAQVVLHSVLEGPQSWDNLVGIILSAVHQDKSAGESKKTAYRVASLYRRLCVDGEIDIGRPPLGYKRVWVRDGVVLPANEKGATPRLVPDDDHPERPRAVRWAFEAYADRDLSLLDICRELESRGIETGRGKRVWRSGTLVRMLRNPRYAGFYVFGRTSMGKFHEVHGQEVKESPNARSKGRPKRTYHPQESWRVIANHHEALVGVELFMRVQELLSSNRKRTTPLRGRGDFLLTKLLICGACGGPMVGGRDRAGRVIYQCSQARNLGTCRLNTVREAEVVCRVIDTLECKFLNPAFLDRLREKVRELQRESSSEEAVARLRGERASLEKDIARVRGRLAKIADEGTFEFLSGQVASWVRRTKEIDAELEALGEPAHAEVVEDIIKEVSSSLWDLREAEQSGDREQLRVVLRKVTAAVKVDVAEEAYGSAGKRFRYVLCGGEVVARGSGALACAIPGGATIKLEEGCDETTSAASECSLLHHGCGWR
jgi:site-specific DNA recombinase